MRDDPFYPIVDISRSVMLLEAGKLSSETRIHIISDIAVCIFFVPETRKQLNGGLIAHVRTSIEIEKVVRIEPVLKFLLRKFFKRSSEYDQVVC